MLLPSGGRHFREILNKESTKNIGVVIFHFLILQFHLGLYSFVKFDIPGGLCAGLLAHVAAYLNLVPYIPISMVLFF